jgi:hypothetical protein
MCNLNGAIQVLVLQNSMLALMMRHSRIDDGGDLYFPSTAVKPQPFLLFPKCPILAIIFRAMTSNDAMMAS